MTIKHKIIQLYRNTCELNCLLINFKDIHFNDHNLSIIPRFIRFKDGKLDAIGQDEHGISFNLYFKDKEIFSFKDGSSKRKMTETKYLYYKEKYKRYFRK